jgi:4-hydroxybenzoate polyprenyltransferase
VVAVSLVAGGDVSTAGRLGVAMTALQVSIGALNDVVDAPRDAGQKPGKPIPAGTVSPGVARAVVVVAAALGLCLSLASGPWTVALGVVVLAIGYGYDLVAKGTAWSWLPFAIGIPLLPVFGWLGTTGELPGFFRILVPVAVVAGGALAIANARPDAERDAAAGVESVAVRLGNARSWLVSSILLLGVGAVAVVTLVAWGAPAGAVGGAVTGVGLLAIGIDAGRSRLPARLERAWEVDAIGVAVLAAAWLTGVVGGG